MSVEGPSVQELSEREWPGTAECQSGDLPLRAPAFCAKSGSSTLHPVLEAGYHWQWTWVSWFLSPGPRTSTAPSLRQAFMSPR